VSLKYWTTGAFVFGLGLICAVPFVIAGKPNTSDLHLARVWLLQFGIFVCVTAFVWVGVAILAMLLMRQIRRDVVHERERNMQVLMEATLADHQRKQDPGESESA
jgi:hypothetical protein